MPPKLMVDVTALASRPDITQGGTVHVGSVVVSATGVSSGGTTFSLDPSDLNMADAVCLGRGSSGSVLRVRRRSDGQVLALKEIRVTSQSHLQEIQRELSLLLDKVDPSPFLVSYEGAYSREGSVFIAMEVMDCSLESLRPVESPEMLARLTRCILSGLVYLHKRRKLVHRDLKPGNVLVNCKGEVKVSDFGVSTQLESSHDDTMSFVGTVSYMSPERLRGEAYSFPADIWSVGLLVAELHLGVHPFADIMPEGQGSEGRFWALLQHTSGDNAISVLPAGADPMLADFVACCLRKDPTQRGTASQLLGHLFITMYAKGSDEENWEEIEDWLEDHRKGKVQGGEETSKSVDLDSALGRLATLGKK